mgnify:CR=1 FL=1
MGRTYPFMAQGGVIYAAVRSHRNCRFPVTRQVDIKPAPGASVTQLLHEANGPALGDYLFQFLRKTPRSVETIAGLAGLNKSSLYRILNAEVSPQRNVLLRLSRVLGMNLSETQKLLKIGDLASLSGSSPRDIVIIDGILRELDIIDINNRLEKNGFSDLFSKK